MQSTQVRRDPPIAEPPGVQSASARIPRPATSRRVRHAPPASKPVAWKLSLGRYRDSVDGYATDVNLRGNTEDLTFWIGDAVKMFVAAAIAMWLGIKREDLIKTSGKKAGDPDDPHSGAVV